VALTSTLLTSASGEFFSDALLRFSDSLGNSKETLGGALQPLLVGRAKSSELGRGRRDGLLEVLEDTIGFCLYVVIGRRVLGLPID
jgi:hypothetical protein